MCVCDRRGSCASVWRSYWVSVLRRFSKGCWMTAEVLSLMLKSLAYSEISVMHEES